MTLSQRVIAGFLGVLIFGFFLFLFWSPDQIKTGNKQMQTDEGNKENKNVSESSQMDSNPNKRDTQTIRSREDAEKKEPDQTRESKKQTNGDFLESEDSIPPGVPERTSVWAPDGSRFIEIQDFKDRKQTIIERLRNGGEEARIAVGEVAMILREADRGWKRRGAFRTSILEATRKIQDPEERGNTLLFLVGTKGWNLDYEEIIREVEGLPTRSEFRIEAVRKAIYYPPSELTVHISPPVENREERYSILLDRTEEWKKFAINQYMGASLQSDWREQWKNLLDRVKEFEQKIIEQRDKLK